MINLEARTAQFTDLPSVCFLQDRMLIAHGRAVGIFMHEADESFIIKE